jgi:hypothetical protein
MPSKRDCEPHTPPREIERKEYDTVKRKHFFDAFDFRSPSDSLNQICKREDINLPPSTARRWLKQREILGSPAIRKTRKLSSKLGRNAILPDSLLEELQDEKHPLNNKRYDQIVQELDLPVSAHTLQYNCVKRTGAKRFKKVKSSTISKENKGKRIIYGQEHRDKGIGDFWGRIWFTDEAHFNSKELIGAAEYSLHRPSEVERLKRVNETPKSDLDVTLHVAGGISYNKRGILIFYNDPIDPEESKQARKSRPRKSEVETEEEYRQKVANWELTLPPKRESGNSMTMACYTENILPYHIEAVKALEEQTGQPCWLQEDNDSSHGTRSANNQARRLKDLSGIRSLIHIAQSPDLNPIEACWLILKKRLRGRKFLNIQEFKEAIMREWGRITQAQIRRRISDMPRRCQMLCNNEGRRIKSDLW